MKSASSWIRQLKVIAWDLDGTLYPHNRDMSAEIDKKKLSLVAEHLNCSISEAEEKFMGLYKRLKSNTKTLDVLGLSGHRFSLDIWEAMDFNKYIDPDPDLATALEAAVKQESHQHFILTNSNSQDTVQAKLDAIGIRKSLFSKVMTSIEIGFNKPDHEAFQPLLSEAASPQEILYIGDREHVDIAPAKELGMQTALINWDNSDGTVQLTSADRVFSHPKDLLRLLVEN